MIGDRSPADAQRGASGIRPPTHRRSGWWSAVAGRTRSPTLPATRRSSVGVGCRFGGGGEDFAAGWRPPTTLKSRSEPVAFPFHRRQFVGQQISDRIRGSQKPPGPVLHLLVQASHLGPQCALTCPSSEDVPAPTADRGPAFAVPPDVRQPGRRHGAFEGGMRASCSWSIEWYRLVFPGVVGRADVFLLWYSCFFCRVFFGVLRPQWAREWPVRMYLLVFLVGSSPYDQQFVGDVSGGRTLIV